MNALLIILQLWVSPQAPAAPFPLRGFTAIEKVISERLLEEGKEFNFYGYFSPKDDGFDLTAFSLIQLLGSYGSAGNNEFRNGTPNSVNMLLWRVALQLTANETKKYCLREQVTLPFHPIFKATLDGICRWPNAEAKTEESLRAFWTAVMGADAPDSEFEAWMQFALTSSVAAKPAGDAVPDLFFAMVYNPHFLLRK